MALNYLSYTLQVHDYLMELKHVLKSYNASPRISAWLAEIDRLNEKLENMRFQVAVVGEFKRGKTSFINALLRKQILPADVVPATATINRITYGNVPASYIYWNNGRPAEKVEIDQLADYITKLTDQSAMQAQNIDEAVVYYPCRFCEDNVDLIDTPGMNDDDTMNSVTIRKLSDIDLAIVTLDPNAPVSNTEARFIAQLVESEQIWQIVFVLSKMDTVAAKHREKLLDLIRNRLQSLVRAVLLETHDENDPVLEKYAELFTEPLIFPVSNLKALYAYKMGDQQALEDSGFLRLNEELPPLIIRTQHKAAVMTPINTAVSISRDFIQLLRQWEQRTMEEDRLRAMKKAFAESAYRTRPASGKIWSEYTERLSRLRGERSDTVFSAVLSTARHYYDCTIQKDALLLRVKELFRGLNTELAQEEWDSYYQVWNEYLRPEYEGLCQRLKELTQPYPELLCEIEPELSGLVNCASLSELPPDPEPFYWEFSPIPPSNTPPGQLAYVIDSVVRLSFAGYYRRRQSRMAEFLKRSVEEQEGKTALLVQKLFEAVKSAIPAAEYIRVEQGTLERLSGQLDRLTQRCGATGKKYMKEAENDE